MAVPRLLLLTATPPGTEGVGEMYLQTLCLQYPRDRLVCFAVPHKDYGPRPDDLTWLPIEYCRQPITRGGRILGGRLSSLLVPLWRQYAGWVHIPRMAAQAVRFGEQHQVEMVWAICTPPVIHMARRVASALNARLVITVWDTLEFESMNRRYDPVLHRALMNEFERVLRSSIRCGVASEGMAAEYRRRYGIKPVVMILGVHPKLRRLPASRLTSDDKFVIGFAGKLYTSREWQALFEALSSVGWRIAGREVKVRILGTGVNVTGRSRMCVEYLGWRSLEECVELLAQVDVTYLPYWFDEAHSLAVQTAFPNKLSTYLAAGRPVMFHGPEESSPTDFFRRFPVGLCCHSLDKEVIIETLTRFIIDQDFYVSTAAAIQQGLDQELDLCVFRRRFAELIGIEENELIPVEK